MGAAHRSRPLAWPVALSEIKAHKNGVFCGVIPFGHAPAAKRPRRDAELAGDVTHTDILIACANCGRTVPEADAKDAGWRYWSDGVGGLHPFCPGCAAREFSSDRPASASTWQLTWGHEVPLLDEHERPDKPPRRPRMCPVCQRLRNVANAD